MTQVKILVNNIDDVTHRAASETEINVYLKMGWKIISANQHINAENGFLILTTILEKAADEKPEEKEPKAAVEATTVKEKADPALKDKAEIKEEKPVKEEQEEKSAKDDKTEEEKVDEKPTEEHEEPTPEIEEDQSEEGTKKKE